ncbi:hypothetical protein J6590_077766 [Homalodisca vitripennis]|nr:hypothetical protein J6590_077766 [Homalodisca vitripennis]
MFFYGGLIPSFGARRGAPPNSAPGSHAPPAPPWIRPCVRVKKKLTITALVYWKLVQHPVTKSCTVVVGSNNVFLTQPPTPICSTATPEGWPTLTNLAKGYVYYCDYDSFKKTVPYVPDVDCKDLFEFPEKNK